MCQRPPDVELISRSVRYLVVSSWSGLPSVAKFSTKCLTWYKARLTNWRTLEMLWGVGHFTTFCTFWGSGATPFSETMPQVGHLLSKEATLWWLQFEVSFMLVRKGLVSFPQTVSSRELHIETQLAHCDRASCKGLDAVVPKPRQASLGCWIDWTKQSCSFKLKSCKHPPLPVPPCLLDVWPTIPHQCAVL